MSIRSLGIAQSIAPDLVALRRRLHQLPEIGLDLPQTQAIVLEGTTTGGSQALDLAAAQGGFVELSFAQPGRYPVVNHVIRAALAHDPLP